MCFKCSQDYTFHRGKSEYEDVLQSGGKPSTLTDRGHQSPAAFLILGSGLDKVYFLNYILTLEERLETERIGSDH